jgi:type I restriction-modification system DNA methylase subunit
VRLLLCRLVCYAPRHAAQPVQRICDPACGTAGFLISALNHILSQHTKPADLKRGLADGSMLKPAQWKFLEDQAFTGFDNDANMVKIAILNLYLHQLERAKIEHFNALTTGFGGNYPGKMFDCILAKRRIKSANLRCNFSSGSRQSAAGGA